MKTELARPINLLLVGTIVLFPMLLFRAYRHADTIEWLATAAGLLCGCVTAWVVTPRVDRTNVPGRAAGWTVLLAGMAVVVCAGPFVLNYASTHRQLIVAPYLAICYGIVGAGITRLAIGPRLFQQAPSPPTHWWWLVGGYIIAVILLAIEASALVGTPSATRFRAIGQWTVLALVIALLIARTAAGLRKVHPREKSSKP